MGDRVVVMNNGVVRQIGTPADVYDEPADTFVATFLGSPPMNLRRDGEAVVGFRPEHFVPAGVPSRACACPSRFRLETRSTSAPSASSTGGSRAAASRASASCPAFRRATRRSRPTARRRRSASTEPDLKFFDTRHGVAPLRAFRPRLMAEAPPALARAGDAAAGDPLRRRARRRALPPRLLLRGRRREGRIDGIPLRRPAQLRLVLRESGLSPGPAQFDRVHALLPGPRDRRRERAGDRPQGGLPRAPAAAVPHPPALGRARLHRHDRVEVAARQPLQRHQLGPHPPAPRGQALAPRCGSASPHSP